jgi:hypothetical protein
MAPCGYGQCVIESSLVKEVWNISVHSKTPRVSKQGRSQELVVRGGQTYIDFKYSKYLRVPCVDSFCQCILQDSTGI